MMMNLPKETRKVPFVIVVVLINFIVGPRLIFCQKSGGGGGGLEIIAQEVYRSMSNYTSVFKSAIKKELGYCIVDV